MQNSKFFRPSVSLCLCLAIACGAWSGCSRTHYRLKADRDAYGLLNEKAGCTPWQVPMDYTILPDPQSRFYDPTCLDDPALPMPAPQLYAYDLPPLPGGANENRGFGGDGSVPAEEGFDESSMLRRLPPVALRAQRPSTTGGEYDIQQVSFQDRTLANFELADPATMTQEEILETILAEEPDLVVQDIPADYWEVLPETCLPRMFEFLSVREEYQETYDRPVPSKYLDDSERLTLEDIVYLASINSREYQRQKELLYVVALRLSLERFDYALKFSTSNNGFDSNWQHSQVSGISQSSLALPGVLQSDMALATGGDLLARFANDVVLTFNGPQGFAADVTTDMLMDVSQSVFQRDIRLESLTQAERDVVYQARDFARFRKELFDQLASQYYGLILNYRSIEITAQNYFILLRGFLQVQEEFRAGDKPQFELDQFEQQILSGRNALISVCNSLENTLDGLKVTLGLPTETLLNLDLSELEQLTRSDELEVTGNLIVRTQDRLQDQLREDPPNRNELLGTDILLTERMLRFLDLRTELGEEQLDRRPAEIERSILKVQTARARYRRAATTLKNRRDPSLPLLISLTNTINNTVPKLLLEQMRLAVRSGVDGQQVAQLYKMWFALRKDRDTYTSDLDTAINKRETEKLPDFLNRTLALRERGEQLIAELDRLLGLPETPLSDEENLQATVKYTEQLLAESESLLNTVGTGLKPVEIDMDEAMLTALVLRMDLMNERGALADDWRSVKLAGDELRSVLNLNASQFLSTNRDLNRFFDTTTDVSRTQLRLSFDAPLNRRAQRNAYRQSLINYQVALRNLQQFEDTIKLSIRRDLRALRVGKQQYDIAVAGAALADLQRLNTEVEYLEGIGEVTARDFLQAQARFVERLVDVADRHIGYIQDRTQLFLDLELMIVDERGFWNELYDEEYQPTPYFQLPPYAEPAYGELPCRTWHSQAVKRMNFVPTGISTIARQRDEGETAAPEFAPEDIESPPPAMQPLPPLAPPPLAPPPLAPPPQEAPTP